MLKTLASIPTVCASSTQKLELWNGKSREALKEGWACWHTPLVPALNRQRLVEIRSVQGQSVLHSEILSKEAKTKRTESIGHREERNCDRQNLNLSEAKED